MPKYSQEFNQELGERIETAHKRQKLSRTKIADMQCITASMLLKYEHGMCGVSPVTAGLLVELTKLLQPTKALLPTSSEPLASSTALILARGSARIVPVRCGSPSSLRQKTLELLTVIAPAHAVE